MILAETDKELQDAMEVRKEVFVHEQNVPLEEEIDEFENTSDHFVLYDENEPVGAGRFRLKDEQGKVERICVLAKTRGKGAGKVIMDFIEEHARSKDVPALILNAQTHAIPFYEGLGYSVTSDEFLDAGIPHKSMKKILN
ncbi:GNAT family N-acetyltransferase [Rossellomorea vietnamensis]|uniref:GNAT family N-acetyltransferase n=1 Tax=Rossellomorea vietnamensis TaxID=218284 RepID=A0A5D4M6Z3_9BACI|nr:GNAT family N-acetyltransferase [Rossellomorea vietnamensis]TYR97669.1 GNAT family N-acetyltransferase [Rossellomorea vietnamensis]